MIVSDENLHQQFVNDLLADGFIVQSVKNIQIGMDDRDVAKWVLAKDALLITEDKDFGELIFAHKIPRITVVFLRYKKDELAIVRQALRQVIAEYYPKEGNFFITITAKKVRITAL
jgi:predicted nuclease of predicted toxin-antitoxin system